MKSGDAPPSCGVEVEYEDCDTDDDGNETCTTYTVCESCGYGDCSAGCCAWQWRMYGQNENVNSLDAYSVSFGEQAENVRLESVIALAVEPPMEIQDCLSDLANRNESVEENEGTVPTATVLWTPEWYGTRVPVARPRRLPVPVALHTYGGDVGAPVLNGVDQDDLTGEVILLTSANWADLEFRMWPYDGRVPNDRLPGRRDPGRQHSGHDLNNPLSPSGGVGAIVDDRNFVARVLPQASQLVQWTSVPSNGRMPAPSMKFIYEMFDWDDSGASQDWNLRYDETPAPQLYNPPVRVGNDGSAYPGSRGVVQRNYYDWAIYTFQLRWKDPLRRNLTSNTVNAMLHLDIPGGSNPCPTSGPASTICGFRVNQPENTALAPWGTFGAHSLPSVVPGWGAASFLGVYNDPWLRSAPEWFYTHTARYGSYELNHRAYVLANTWEAYRVESPEVRPSLSVSVYRDPVTEEEDIELQIGQLAGTLASGWVDVRFWPHSGTNSTQVMDHKWYSLGDVQGRTVRLGRDYGGVLRCWQYRSDNFRNVETCGEDEDVGRQRTDALMDFTNLAYENFRNWRTWNFQIRVIKPESPGGGEVEYFTASSPSQVSLLKFKDPAKQVVDDSVTHPLLTDPARPHSLYECRHGSSRMSNQLVNRYGAMTGAPVFQGNYNCDSVLPMEEWVDVDLNHHGAASGDAGADDPNTPGWRHLEELGESEFTVVERGDPPADPFGNVLWEFPEMDESCAVPVEDVRAGVNAARNGPAVSTSFPAGWELTSGAARRAILDDVGSRMSAALPAIRSNATSLALRGESSNAARELTLARLLQVGLDYLTLAGEYKTSDVDKYWELQDIGQSVLEQYHNAVDSLAEVYLCLPDDPNDICNADGRLVSSVPVAEPDQPFVVTLVPGANFDLGGAALGWSASGADVVVAAEGMSATLTYPSTCGNRCALNSRLPVRVRASGCGRGFFMWMNLNNDAFPTSGEISGPCPFTLTPSVDVIRPEVPFEVVLVPGAGANPATDASNLRWNNPFLPDRLSADRLTMEFPTVDRECRMCVLNDTLWVNAVVFECNGRNGLWSESVYIPIASDEFENP